MRYGWTLEKQEWLQLSVISRTDWSKTKFNSLYRENVPESSGVYAICSTPPDFTQLLIKTLYNIIYVGKSKSLRRRFLEHCNRPKLEIEMAQHCFGDSLEYWFTEVSLEEIDELEARLIDCFGPPANLVRGHIPARVESPHPA